MAPALAPRGPPKLFGGASQAPPCYRGCQVFGGPASWASLSKTRSRTSTHVLTLKFVLRQRLQPVAGRVREARHLCRPLPSEFFAVPETLFR
jgi:hypothetical protein